MTHSVLSPAEITSRLADSRLKDWQYQDGFLTKHFVFKNFQQAVGFWVQTALVSESLNHHANWSGVYNRISIQLQTHDAQGITELDLKWALAAEKILAGLVV